MKKLLLIFLLIFYYNAFSQSATLVPGSVGNIQVPKLSYQQINAIPNPKAGMMAFDSTYKCLKYYNGSKWLCTSQTDEGGNAVSFTWRKNFFSPPNISDDYLEAVTVDDQNNVYITGWASTYPTYYAFVAKFSPSGALLWEYKGSEMFDRGTKIKVDANKNVFVSMNYSYRSSRYITLIKFSPNGNLEWEISLGGIQNVTRSADNIFIDNNQDIYLTGVCYGSLSVGTFTINSSERNFICKIASNGTPLSLKALTYNQAKVNKNGECYFAGNFTNSVTIDGNTLYSSGSEDFFFGKYSSNGSLAWVKKAGGNGIDKVNAIDIDTNGDMYLTGSFSSTAYFDSTPVTSFDSEDYYLAKYRNDGFLLWIKNGGGAGEDKGMQVELTATNQPTVLGSSSSNSLVFYPNIGLNPLLAPGKFLIKHHADTGDINWVKPIENATNLKVKPSGEIYTWENLPFASPPDYMHIFTKFSGEGNLIYRKINGGIIDDINFGVNNHFFVAGEFTGTASFGSSMLTSQGTDTFISNWME